VRASSPITFFMPSLMSFAGAVMIALLMHGLASQASAQRARSGDLPPAMREALGVRLNRDSLASVLARLGPTPARSTGEGGESQITWCYQAKTGPSPFVITFASDAEMGGEGHEVDEIRVTRRDRIGAAAQRCGVIEPGKRAITLGGLHLGMTRAQSRDLLGEPTVVHGDSAAYVWASEEPLPPSHPNYAYWSARRTECFAGRAPFVSVAGRVIVRYDRRGAYEIVVIRGDNAIC
jgi:hypothetical protein